MADGIQECEENSVAEAYSSSDENDESVKQTKNKRFPCKHCGKVFTSSWKVKRHERKHTREVPFACPSCKRRFNDKSVLLNHQRTFKHHDWKFECERCKKRFATGTSLRRHTVTACVNYSELFKKRGW